MKGGRTVAETVETLATANAKIASLESRLQQLQARTERLEQENRELYQRLKQTAAAIAPPEQPLRGMRIAVIGHPRREPHYRELIAYLGGECLFANAGEKLGLIDRVVQKSNATIYLTGWGSHKASQRMESAAIRYGRPYFYDNEAGMANLERLLLETVVPTLQTPS